MAKKTKKTRIDLVWYRGREEGPTAETVLKKLFASQNRLKEFPRLDIKAYSTPASRTDGPDYTGMFFESIWFKVDDLESFDGEIQRLEQAVNLILSIGQNLSRSRRVQSNIDGSKPFSYILKLQRENKYLKRKKKK